MEADTIKCRMEMDTNGVSQAEADKQRQIQVEADKTRVQIRMERGDQQ